MSLYLYSMDKVTFLWMRKSYARHSEIAITPFSLLRAEHITSRRDPANHTLEKKKRNNNEKGVNQVCVLYLLIF